MEDPETDPDHDSKVKKHQIKKQRPKCSHCEKIGHNDKKCWLLHPELAPEDSQKRATNKKKKNLIRASVC